MTLTIITINRNNASGLEKTMESVISQTWKDFEYVIVDGASTDGSVEVIRSLAERLGERLRWVSEPDKGIYNAMNKGIGMASGDYLQFLNSGDYLASDDVIERMYDALEKGGRPGILYGNLLKDIGGRCILRDRSFAGQEITFLDFYTGTLNHSSAYIRRNLFTNYGCYDERLKIVSDWEWYLQAIIFGSVKPAYTDVDVTVFDMNGISETSKALEKAERKQVLNELINSAILADYEQWAFYIDQIKRLKRHPWAYKVIWFIERCLFKLEKRQNRRKQKVECN